MRISVFAPEYGVIEAVTPAFRTFTTANEFLTAQGKDAFFDVEYVGLREQVPANNGEYTIRAHRLLHEVSATDLLIIPPPFGDLDNGLQVNADAFPHIRQLHRGGAMLASLCLGAFILAESGLLSGKRCSTHWAYVPEFRRRYPDVAVQDGAIISEHGNIFSSGGASSLWNLLLYLVEKFADRETAVLIAKYFALDIGRDSQAQFAIFRGQRNHNDPQIKAVQDYLEAHYEERITIDGMAQMVNTSRRTFERRFCAATSNTPNAYLQRVRIEAAKNLFEISQKNVTEVMLDVGYSDIKAFREIFKKITGMTPLDYRGKFGRVAYEV